MVVLVALVGATEGEVDLETWIGAGAITLLAGVIVGRPIAYFATRRLERLMRFATSTFE